ncbi:hypothetical protein Pcinc_015278 [Petrolisthes cinctipes]|uniref:RING-type domain-containing protein n=1 Tax=Petrolisthes cinctipes TaxID=88211 RepID=A0AAE1KPX2_PETCI|nr:hypothetical protein Pcinc_015278 [Petrolisthes cinctipes]
MLLQRHRNIRQIRTMGDYYDASYEIQCPLCRGTKYRNPQMKLMVNVCGHPMCDSCVRMYFLKESAQCPECDIVLKRSKFRVQVFEDPLVEKELDIRRKDEFYKYEPPVLSPTLPAPTWEEVEAGGYLNHVRRASPQAMAGEASRPHVHTLYKKLYYKDGSPVSSELQYLISNSQQLSSCQALDHTSLLLPPGPLVHPSFDINCRL